MNADSTKPDSPVTDSPDASVQDMPETDMSSVPSQPEQERMVEALLFATAEPMTIAQLTDRLPQGSDPKQALEQLREHYEGRGVRIVQVGPGWAIRTAPEMGFLMRRDSVESRKLSRAAIETLAIIAYHQPVTRVEIEEIRGVGVSRGTIDRLLELDWIKLGRRRETPGRPVTFVVTTTFLDHFGLESVRDLPGIAELRASGLLDAGPPDSGLLKVDSEDDAGSDPENDVEDEAGSDSELDLEDGAESDSENELEDRAG